MTTINQPFTRLQYLNDECSHEQYYDQFVNDAIVTVVLNQFTEEELQEAYADDKYFNTIPIKNWDMVAHYVLQYYGVGEKLRSVGDVPTLAGGVCIVKAAARKVVLK